MKQDKQSFCMTISRTEKDGTQPIIFYTVYLIKVDMSFSLNTDVFISVSAKLKCQILLFIYQIPYSLKSEVFKMVKRNISFYEKKNGYKNMNFARKEKFILWQSSCFELFGDGKYALFLIQIGDVR